MKGMIEEQLINRVVKIMAEAEDFDKELNNIFRVMAERLGFDDILLSEFIGNGYVQVRCYYSSRSESVSSAEIHNYEEWDDFLAMFDEQGLCVVKNVDLIPFSEEDKAFFMEKNMKSFVNILLYDMETPIAYLTFSKAIACEYSEKIINTLCVFGRILTSFIASRLRRKKDKSKIEELSTDELTGLYTYAAFQRKLKKRLSNYNPACSHGILAIDISNFSHLNESFGYEEGDRILRHMSGIIGEYENEDSLSCHVIADQFLMYVTGETDEIIEKIAREIEGKIYGFLKGGYPLSGMYVKLGIRYITDPSIGIRILIDEANHARKSLATNYTDFVSVFSEEMHKNREKALEIVGTIHSAIEQGYVEAFLQPKFSMNSKEVIGAEALTRWRTPEGGYIFPDVFIPILEEAGLIIELDLCIFRQVLEKLQVWIRDGERVFPISVNMSRVNFEKTDFAETIVNMTQQYGIPPRFIEIEITESGLTNNKKHLYAQLYRLREVGFRINMDDFGTGYSSLNMLMVAPVDVIKVDKSFIDHYESEKEREYIKQIGHLIEVANKEIIFEGVETEGQIELLTTCGYDKAQGYYFSKPIHINEFEKKYVLI